VVSGEVLVKEALGDTLVLKGNLVEEIIQVVEEIR
jgi:hypothetical protein